MDKVVGDTLHLVGPERAADFEIIGVLEFPLETAFMEWQQLAEFVGFIRNAPTPNAYWEELDVEWDNGDGPEEDTVWALGVSDQAGRLLSPRFNTEDQGVIISEALAEAGGFAVGDEIKLRPPDGSLINELVEEVSEDYTIIEVVPIKTSELRVFARSLPDDVRAADKPLLIAMYWDTLADLVQFDYREVTPETVYIDLANPEASTSRLNTRYIRPVPSYQDQVGFEDRIAQTILSLGLAMSIAAILMAVVGGIGLLTITSIGVFERQREIGVMRSVGASSRAIIFQFLLEGVLVGLLAWGVGLPLSIMFGRVLIDMVPFSEVIVLNYTVLAPLLGLLGMVLVTLGATLYPALTAARKTVSDILRYQ
ncbi:MAG: FtsX-like permease family protein [Chloroflexi bacterium]|nr:MAG: FtsX-like permease family protein [Chloroflexota bacterium]